MKLKLYISWMKIKGVLPIKKNAEIKKYARNVLKSVLLFKNVWNSPSPSSQHNLHSSLSLFTWKKIHPHDITHILNI